MQSVLWTDEQRRVRLFEYFASFARRAKRGEGGVVFHVD